MKKGKEICLGRIGRKSLRKLFKLASFCCCHEWSPGEIENGLNFSKLKYFVALTEAKEGIFVAGSWLTKDVSSSFTANKNPATIPRLLFQQSWIMAYYQRATNKKQLFDAKVKVF